MISGAASWALPTLVLVTTLGALVTVFVMLRWGSVSSASGLDDDIQGDPDDPSHEFVRLVRRDRAAQRDHAVRVGHGVVVICFAAATILSVVALVSTIGHRTPASPSAGSGLRGAEGKDAEARAEERIRALEERLAAAEARAATPPPAVAAAAPVEERAAPAPQAPAPPAPSQVPEPAPRPQPAPGAKQQGTPPTRPRQPDPVASSALARSRPEPPTAERADPPRPAASSAALRGVAIAPST